MVKKKKKKIKWGKILKNTLICLSGIGLLYFIFKGAVKYLPDLPEKILDLFGGQPDETIKKKKKSIQSKKKNVQNKDQQRKSVRDKHSKIVSMILLISLIPALVFGEYIVWDKEDCVYRDYGTKEEYIKSLEEEKDLFIRESTTNKMIIKEQDQVIELQEEKIKWWKRKKIESDIEKWTLRGICLALLYMIVRGSIQAQTP